MKKFLELGNRYAAQSDWKDFALTKFCLFSMGILIGVNIPKPAKKSAVMAAGVCFLVTYIPLMAKVFKIFMQMRNETVAED